MAKKTSLALRLLILFIGIVISCHSEKSIPSENSAVLPPEPEPIHEAFSLSLERFQEIQDLPEAALVSPDRFLDLAAGMLELSEETLVLVDKNMKLSADYVPASLVELDSYPDLTVSRAGLKLTSSAAEALTKMSLTAQEDGINIVVSSAYRSYSYQEALFARHADRDGEEAASRYSARAGSSQHQLGTVVDLGDITNKFADSNAGLWMVDNAAAFGWSLSYPKGAEGITGYIWESWHWRWIGMEAAAMQREFFAGSQQALLEFWNSNSPVFREARITE